MTFFLLGEQKKLTWRRWFSLVIRCCQSLITNMLVQSLEYNVLSVCGLWESICCTFVCVFKTWLAGFQDYAGKHLNFDVQSHWVIHCTVNYECVCGGWRPASVMGWIKVMPIQVLRMKQMHSTCLWCLGVCMCFWITPKMWIVKENRRRRHRWGRTMAQ